MRALGRGGVGPGVCRRGAGRFTVINFEEELKKFHPSIEVDEAEDVITGHNLTDFTDILVKMVGEHAEETRNRKA